MAQQPVIQSTSSGPRYVFTVPSFTRTTNLAQTPDQQSQSDERNPRWVLTDPGPLHLAATCRELRALCLSPTVPENLVLEIPQPPDDDGMHLSPRRGRGRNGNLRAHLYRMRMGIQGRGRRLTRCVLHSRWTPAEADPLAPLLYTTMMREILWELGVMFGDELMVMVMCMGDRAVEDFRAYAPRKVRELEDMGRSIRSHEENNYARRHDANLPWQWEAAPLSLHMYFGYEQYSADNVMAYAIKTFGDKNLQSLYLSSALDNVQLVGNRGRPMTGDGLSGVLDDLEPRNPWTHFLPQRTSVYKTIKSITLDCAVFWSEVANVLPYLSKLERLDCELALLHPPKDSLVNMPFEFEGKEQAGRSILETCLDSEVTHQRQRGLDENRGREWIGIKREGIVLPAMEPVAKDVAIVSERSSVCSRVDPRVSTQALDLRAERSRRA